MGGSFRNAVELVGAGRIDPEREISDKPESNGCPEKKLRTQGSLTIIFLIWNTATGTSIITIPWAFAHSGYVLSIVICLILGGIAFYTCQLVVRVGEKTRALEAFAGMRDTFDFQDLVELHLGRKWRVVACFFSILVLWAIIAEFWIFLSTFLQQMGIFVYGYVWQKDSRNCSLFHNSSGRVLIINRENVTGTCYWDSTLDVRTDPVFDNINKLMLYKRMSSAGAFSVAVVIVFVVVKAGIWGIHMDIEVVDNGIRLADIYFPVVCGISSQSYFVHNSILALTSAHKYPSRKVRDVGIAYALIAATYILVGLAYYVCFPGGKKQISDNVLDVIERGDYFAFITIVLLTLKLVFTIPLFSYIIKMQFMRSIMRKSEFGYQWTVLTNVIIITVAVLLAMFWPHVGQLLRFLGAVSGGVFIYILPGLVYMAVQRKENKLTWYSILFHSSILLLGLAIFGLQFSVPFTI
ncbi:putative Sodium-coupled neutral amino acid transporter 9-like protein [Hypsibius exemplaris]|uniref:Sodium-coupled neutral amino acid transporter 9-like protein n=1 Tax=Hypsibius exemplaris TaxID=2072580 RepID=A0A9X6NHF3_HYPEX|nr:putative Sodium-coupled neutral amino acid transporter 9-like protein [Hypsibius exemplaris]